MQRTAIVTEACRRLGDETTSFKTLVDAAFDFVLADLAAHDAIDALVNLKANFQFTAAQRSYVTQTMCGLSGTNYPYDVLKIHCHSWGTEGFILRAESDWQFDLLRAANGEAARGKPRLWRFYPDRNAIEFEPTPGTSEDATDVEILFTGPPTFIGSATELTEVRLEDVETIVHGLMARAAHLRDDSADLAAGEWQLYLAGRSRMWGRRYNEGPKRIQPYGP